LGPYVSTSIDRGHIRSHLSQNPTPRPDGQNVTLTAKQHQLGKNHGRDRSRLDKPREQTHQADEALRRGISFMKPPAPRQIRPSHVNRGRPHAYDSVGPSRRTERFMHFNPVGGRVPLNHIRSMSALRLLADDAGRRRIATTQLRERRDHSLHTIPQSLIT